MKRKGIAMILSLCMLLSACGRVGQNTAEQIRENADVQSVEGQKSDIAE